jgi:hypothetical protein
LSSNFISLSNFCVIIVSMNDKKICELFNIPQSTLNNWKSGKSGEGKKLLYEFLKSFSKEELEKRVEAIKLLKGIK